MTGWRLDQHDLDLWLEIHHLARNATPGEEVRFNDFRFGYSMASSTKIQLELVETLNDRPGEC